MRCVGFLFMLTCLSFANCQEDGEVVTEVPEMETTTADSNVNQLPPGDFKHRIVGGDIVRNRAEFYYQASVRYKSQNYHFCGASIIDSKHLLTAAHCLVDNGVVIPARALTVVVGDLNIRQEDDATVYRTVSDIFIHDEYNIQSNFENDIAVLRIEEDFDNWTPMISNIGLTTTRPMDDTSCIVSGWGATEQNGGLSPVLRFVAVPIVSTERCSLQYPASISGGMLCAGLSVGGKDSCQGDSGGPLVCNNLLAGVVSWGYGCAQPGYSGVYTDVAAYRDWINEQISRSSAFAPNLDLTVATEVTEVPETTPAHSNVNQLPPGDKHRIVGGDIVRNRAEFNYQASVRYKSQNYHFCGASIIDSKHLLTAAHCVVDNGVVIPASALTVVVGDLNIRQEDDATVYRTVSDIFTHDEYNIQSNFENDIAVLRIEKEFDNWTSMIRSIGLTTTRPMDDTSCIVSGWGATEQSGGLSPVLRFVAVPIVSTERCSLQYPASISGGMICAGLSVGGKDSCQGDSGGPLVCNNLLAGVVSWGYGCAQPGYSGVYTDVAAYRDWINEQISKSSAFAPNLAVSSILVAIMSFTILI